MGVGLVLPLVPWAARNWHTLHEVQFLTPRYAQVARTNSRRADSTPGPRTWLWRYGDVYLTLWKLDDEEIPIDEHSARRRSILREERARVADLLDAYNNTLTLSPEQDARIRRDRARAHGAASAADVRQDPALRSLAMWFTPRVELLPFSGRLWPLRERMGKRPRGFRRDAGLFPGELRLRRPGAGGRVDCTAAAGPRRC